MGPRFTDHTRLLCQEDESEYETDSDDEEDGRRLLKPVFVPKQAREVGHMGGHMGVIVDIEASFTCFVYCGACFCLSDPHFHMQTIAEREALEREDEEVAEKEKRRLLERKVSGRRIWGCQEGGARELA